MYLPLYALQTLPRTWYTPCERDREREREGKKCTARWLNIAYAQLVIHSLLDCARPTRQLPLSMDSFGSTFLLWLLWLHCLVMVSSGSWRPRPYTSQPAIPISLSLCLLPSLPLVSFYFLCYSSPVFLTALTWHTIMLMTLLFMSPVSLPPLLLPFPSAAATKRKRRRRVGAAELADKFYVHSAPAAVAAVDAVPHAHIRPATHTHTLIFAVAFIVGPYISYPCPVPRPAGPQLAYLSHISMAVAAFFLLLSFHCHLLTLPQQLPV